MIKRKAGEKLFIILLLFIPILASAKFGKDAKHISFYWGPTYRINNNFYNSFDISYEHYRSSCTNAYYRGFGLRFDNFNNDNYSIGVNYFRSFLRRPDLLLTPYLGLSPVVFKMENVNGLNIKPEIGLRFNTAAFTRRQPVSLSIKVSYGYDIPIINERSFTVGRHDISAKIALTVNLNDINHYLKGRREKKNHITQPTDEINQGI